MIKVCLFDLDGTVVDSNELILTSFKEAFKSHGIENVSDAQIYSFFGEPLMKSMEKVVGIVDAPNLVKSYREYNEYHHDDMVKEFPHVDLTLRKLKHQGYKLGIVTSKRSDMAMRSLQLLELDDIFDLVVTPELTTSHKPDKAPVEYAVKHFNVNPKEVIMIGDSPYDLLSGLAAGTYTVGVKYTKLDPQLLEDTHPHYMISSMEKVFDVIEDIDNKDKK